MSGFQVVGDLELNAAETDVVFAIDERRILQEIRIGLQVFKSTWRYDRNRGIPYRDDIMIKNPQLSALRSIFQQFLLAREGVIAVRYIRFELDGRARHLEMAFSIVIRGGFTVEDSFLFDVVN